MPEKQMTYSEFLDVQRQLEVWSQQIGSYGNSLRDKLHGDSNGIMTLIEFENAIIKRERIRNNLISTDVVVSTQKDD